MTKMETGQVIPTRLLPKTGNTVSTRTGDDGDLEKGWWKGLSFAGNKTRFIARTLDGDDVVIDNATGLMWAADDTEAGCNDGVELGWNDAIDYALALDFAGFTDWLIPNVLELISIVNYGVYNPASYSTFFTNTLSDFYQTSTNAAAGVDDVFHVYFISGLVGFIPKMAMTRNIRCVRSL